MTGQEIREHRITLKMTQTELGAALGVNKNTVARWEREELTPQSVEMLRLAFVGLKLERRRVLFGPALKSEIDRSTERIRRTAKKLRENAANRRNASKSN